MTCGRENENIFVATQIPNTTSPRPINWFLTQPAQSGGHKMQGHIGALWAVISAFLSVIPSLFEFSSRSFLSITNRLTLFQALEAGYVTVMWCRNEDPFRPNAGFMSVVVGERHLEVAVRVMSSSITMPHCRRRRTLRRCVPKSSYC